MIEQIVALAKWARRGARTPAYAAREQKVLDRARVEGFVIGPRRESASRELVRKRIFEERSPSTLTSLFRGYYLDEVRRMAPSELREFASILDEDDDSLDEYIKTRHRSLLVVRPALNTPTFFAFLQYARYHRGDGHERGGEYR